MIIREAGFLPASDDTRELTDKEWAYLCLECRHTARDHFKIEFCSYEEFVRDDGLYSARVGWQCHCGCKGDHFRDPAVFDELGCPEQET